MNQLTPRYVVSELDKYIIGQDQAKRSVAVALRNRLRRLRLDDEMRQEVKPKNILMIGPTGVGKTEIARRLASIAQAPFVKVEATKYTEVGYVGRDVESMVRDLVENAIRIIKDQEFEKVQDQAENLAIERIAKALRPGKKVEKKTNQNGNFDFMEMMKNFAPVGQEDSEDDEVVTEEIASSRRAIRAQIREGKLDNHEVTIKMQEKNCK